jgi:glyoxylase-like metal-dependent hydrolase (beta-lactamase superfamily II)
VLLTHVHVDHIGWTIDAGGEAVFANADYVLSAQEWSFAESRAAEAGAIARRVIPIAALGRLRVVEPDIELLPGCSLVATPGHTPGHVSLVARSLDASACVLGDVCVHRAQLANTRLPYLYDVDPAAAIETRGPLLERLADEGTVVCSSHFPGSGFGYLPRTGTGYRWADALG